MHCGDNVVFWGTKRQPAGLYTAELQWNSIRIEIDAIAARKNDFKCVGMTLDRPNINRQIARLFEEEYDCPAMFCLLHILNSIAQGARQPFVGVLEQLDLLMSALNGTKLGDVAKELLDADYLERRRQRLNNNNHNNGIDIDMAEAKEEEKEGNVRYKSGIPSRATTRTWTSESIMLQWVLKKWNVLSQLATNDAAQPYLTRELINLLGGNDFRAELHGYGWGA